MLNQRPITATRGISPALAIDQIFKEFLQVLDFAPDPPVAAFVKQFFLSCPMNRLLSAVGAATFVARFVRRVSNYE